MTESATYVGRHSAPASEAARPPADHHGDQPGPSAWAPQPEQPFEAPAVSVWEQPSELPAVSMWGQPSEAPAAPGLAPPVDQVAGAPSPAWGPPVEQPAAAPAWPSFDVPPATPPRSGMFRSRNRVIAVAGGAVAVLVLAGGGITAGVSAAAKSDLCGMLGSREKMFSVADRADSEIAAVEAVAKRIRTLSGRLVFSSELAKAADGLADGLDSMATLRRAGYVDTSDVDASTAAQMNAVGFSVIDNLGRAQRACGVPVTGQLPD